MKSDGVVNALAEFILENAQLTTSGNYAIYGTMTPDALQAIKELHTDGENVFANAVVKREMAGSHNK